jgi:hypothetical protein
MLTNAIYFKEAWKVAFTKVEGGNKVHFAETTHYGFPLFGGIKIIRDSLKQGFSTDGSRPGNVSWKISSGSWNFFPEIQNDVLMVQIGYFVIKN